VQRGNLARAAAAEAAAGADPPPFEPVGGGDEDDDAEDDAACADGEVGASPAGAAAADGSASDRCVDDSPAAAALELRIASAEEELEAAYAARDRLLVKGLIEELDLLEQLVPVRAADGQVYFWNTETDSTRWSLPRPVNEPASPAPPSAAPSALSAASGSSAPSSYGGPPRDIAALVFRRFNVSESGELSLQELQALAADRDHPCDEAGIAIAKALLDVNGDGRLTAEVFASWWREGERRWDVFDMEGERRARVEGLVAFFTAFGPAGGALSGDPLVRMHLCLVEQGVTSKTLRVFLQDADPTGDGESLSLYKLHKWYSREAARAHALWSERPPLRPPTLAERRRPVRTASREDFRQERANVARERQSIVQQAALASDAVGSAAFASGSTISMSSGEFPRRAAVAAALPAERDATRDASSVL